MKSSVSLHYPSYTIGRTRHKEEVYSTSIFVWNSGIHAVCLAIAAIAAARANQRVFVSFAETRRFEGSEGSFGASRVVLLMATASCD